MPQVTCDEGYELRGGACRPISAAHADAEVSVADAEYCGPGCLYRNSVCWCVGANTPSESEECELGCTKHLGVCYCPETPDAELSAKVGKPEKEDVDEVICDEGFKLRRGECVS